MIMRCIKLEIEKKYEELIFLQVGMINGEGNLNQILIRCILTYTIAAQR